MEMTIAAVQMRATPGDAAANIAKAKTYTERAADEGARLVLLPELFNVGYVIGPKLFEWWEAEDGRSVTWMREESQARGIVLAGTIAERRGDRLYNTMFVVEPDGRLYKYAKRQPTKNELAAFDPGDDPNILDTSLGRIGVAVCADMTWGASVLRPIAGAVDLLLVPQASNAPRWQGRAVWRLENRLKRPLFAGQCGASARQRRSQASSGRCSAPIASRATTSTAAPGSWTPPATRWRMSPSTSKGRPLPR